MVSFFEVSNCKICKKKGITIYHKKYTDKNIIFFLKEYYGEVKYKLLEKRLVGSNYDLLKCNKYLH